MEKVAFKIPQSEKQQFWQLCHDQGVTPSQAIRNLVRKSMKENVVRN